MLIEWLCDRCHGGRKLEDELTKLVGPELWTVLVNKARREGVSLRALILGWLKSWVQEK
jgi:predicted HicB family RNase H-like nuclease